MILFRPGHVAPILAGKKWQTRRMGRARWRVGSVHQARLCMLDKDSCFAHLEIGGVEAQALHAIQPYEVWAEGYEHFSEYAEVWDRINGAGSWRSNPSVWVVSFRVVCQFCFAPTGPLPFRVNHCECGIDTVYGTATVSTEPHASGASAAIRKSDTP